MTLRSAFLALTMLLMFGKFPAAPVLTMPAFRVAHAMTSPDTLSLDVSKFCPDSAGDGETFTCTFAIINDGDVQAVGMVIRNQVPYPFGPTSAPLPCVLTTPPFGTVTSLLPGQECDGSFTETVNVCANGTMTDQLTVHAGSPHTAPIDVSVSRDVTVPTCTPTNTPTVTPTNTPTPTATPGPSGLLVTKNCPATAGGGDTITCNFTVTNLSNTETIENLTVNNSTFFGGVTTNYGPWDCIISSPTTTLGPLASCSGQITETAPACNVVNNLNFVDYILAQGNVVAGGALRYAYSNDVTTTILACTATPTPGGPTNTPTMTGTVTNTPTVTPTGNTPTPTRTPTPSRTPTITPTFPVTLTATRTRTRTPTSGVPVTVTRTPTPRPSCGTILTGTIRNAAGSPLAINGVVWFQLSSNGNAACCVPPFQVGPQPPITYSLTNGTIAGAAFLIGNDCIQPEGSCFLETVIDRNGNIVLRKNVFVHGATQNVGTLPSCVPRSR